MALECSCLEQLKKAIDRSVNRGRCWASDALLAHTSVSSSGMHHHHKSSTTTVDVALQCAQTRSHLSLAQLLLPLPASFDHYHGLQHHEVEQFGSAVDDDDSSGDKQELRMTVVLLATSPACDSGDCPMQISGSGTRHSEILQITWSGGSSKISANSPLAPPTMSPSAHPPIALHRTSSCLSSASSPAFFPISDTLRLSPYPLHRHISLLPPCSLAQVLCPRFLVDFFLLFLPNDALVYRSITKAFQPVLQQPSDASWPVSTSSLLQVSRPFHHLFHSSCCMSRLQGALPSFSRGIMLANPSVFTPETTALSSLRCKAVFARNFLPVVLPLHVLQQLQVDRLTQRTPLSNLQRLHMFKSGIICRVVDECCRAIFARLSNQIPLSSQRLHRRGFYSI